MPVLTNPPTPAQHLQVNLDDLKRARDEGRAAGGGSPRWLKAAMLLMDHFPTVYGIAQRMNEDAAARRVELLQLRGERETLARWIGAVLPALEVVNALEDFEDGGEHLRTLKAAGEQLVRPVRCATCDVPNGCREFCGCLPAVSTGRPLLVTRYAVTERMPDADTDVLIWDASSQHSQLGAYIGDDDEGPLWVDAQGGGVAGVTHWAEMP